MVKTIEVAMKRETVPLQCYTLYGQLDERYEAWQRWHDEAVAIFEMIGGTVTHYCVWVKEKPFEGKICPIGGYNRRMKNVKNKDHHIEGQSFYMEPEDYEDVWYASGDTHYLIRLERTDNSVSVVFREWCFPRVDEQKLLEMMGRHIDWDYGEIYTILDKETLYALKSLRVAKKYPSLNLIRTVERVTDHGI